MGYAVKLQSAVGDKLLWENPNPDAYWSGQWVTLNDAYNKYKLLVITCNYSYTHGANPYMGGVLETATLEAYGHSGWCMCIGYSVYTSASAIVRRLVTVDNSKTRIYISDSMDTDNGYVIPLKIFGMRTRDYDRH